MPVRHSVFSLLDGLGNDGENVFVCEPVEHTRSYLASGHHPRHAHASEVLRYPGGLLPDDLSKRTDRKFVDPPECEHDTNPSRVREDSEHFGSELDVFRGRVEPANLLIRIHTHTITFNSFAAQQAVDSTQ